METDDPLSFMLFCLNAVTVNPVAVSHLVVFVILLLLIAASAFISGSEVAFFGLDAKAKAELKQEKHGSDKNILKQLDELDYLLATILTANNFVNVSIVLIISYLTNQLFDFSENETLGFIIQTVGITFILLLFGEILPKIYASTRALPFARLMSRPLMILQSLFKPLTSFLVVSTNIVNKRLARHHQNHQNISRDELSTALELTSEELTEEKELLEGIIKFGNITVADIMTSRVDVTDINIKSSFSDVIATITKSGFSRIPIYTDTPDNVKGVLYIKDLLPHLQKQNFRWQTLIRQPYFVPDTKKINDLLEEFQSNKIHMAIIVDEYGGTAGIVTLEDILEEIVGEISDEFDVPEDSYKLNAADGTFIFEGKISIRDFCKVIKYDEEEFEELRGESDTLAGMILEVHGEIPQQGEKISVANNEFQIMEVDNRRIIKVKYYPQK